MPRSRGTQAGTKNKQAGPTGKGGARGQGTPISLKKDIRHDHQLTWTTLQTKSQSQARQQDKLTGDSEVEVTVVGVTIPNTVPVPGFIVAEIMDKYNTDPAVLLLRTTSAINKHRARIDGDPERTKLRADLASYAARWLFGLAALKMRHQEKNQKHRSSHQGCLLASIPGMVVGGPETVPRGQGENTAPPEHPSRQIQQGPRRRNRKPRPSTRATGHGREVPKRHTYKKPKGFAALPTATQKMILLATERDKHGRTATKPTK
jgi:hypothetical protein